MRRCRVCGCSDFAPCIDHLGEACAWFAQDLCSACADQEQEAGVELYTEAEATDFIRQLRYADARVARAEARAQTEFGRYLSAGGGV